jgi:hypothetical protein
MRRLSLLCACLAVSGVRGEDSPTVWLDAVPHGFIANAFGPPKAKVSYGKHRITIVDTEFERGLGTHAPSRLDLNLDGRATRFLASVGVDREVVARHSPDPMATTAQRLPGYVYDGNGDLLDRGQGATVNFRVLGDDRELYRSGWLTESSEARSVDLDVTDVQRLTLEVETGPDGSYADHADWADARLELREGIDAGGMFLTAAPSGLLVNQVGFLPSAGKVFLVHDDRPREFALIAVETGEAVFTGETAPRVGDWGRVFEGDFSAYTQEGTHYLRCGPYMSAPFVIQAGLDRFCLDKHLNWYLWQRCGDPNHGWERGQHADDGRRRDNQKRQDVRGGWHDAADLRKRGMTITGLWALTEWAQTLEDELLLRRVLDEIRWGNTYFLAMQEPDGYLMSHVGGDVLLPGDNNRFTDNIPDTPDDRIIATTNGAPEIQFVFVLAEVAAAQVFKTIDPEYAKRCQTAAEQAYAWQTQRLDPNNAYAVGGALGAASRMFNATPGGRHRGEANLYLKMLLALQDNREGPVSGFFVSRPRSTGASNANPSSPPDPGSPAHNLPMGNLPLWGLCLFCETFAGVPEASTALQALHRHVEGTTLPLAKRSTYGQLPYSLYAEDPGGGRRIGEFYYRWGYVNREDGAPWHGINPHIASTGAGLAKAARLLGRPELRALAQRQLDFIFGVNPFQASTAEGLGTNQPDFFKTTEFVPHTPKIMGAVMAGIGTSHEDQPVLLPGWWQTTEYWMESVAHTAILLHELGRD